MAGGAGAGLLRKVISRTAWLLVALLALLVSLAFHLRLPLAQRVAREMLSVTLSDRIQGQIAIESMHIGLDEVRASGVTIRDPEGREVIHAEDLEATLDPWSLVVGTIRLSEIHLRGGTVRLHVGEASPVSLIDAFFPVEPSEPGGDGGPRVVLDGIEIEDVDVSGEVPGLSGLHVADTHVRARVVIDGDAEISVRAGGGRLLGPFRGETAIEQIQGRFSTRPTRGLTFYIRGRRGEGEGSERVQARVTLHTPSERLDEEGELREGEEPELALSAYARGVSAETLEDFGVPSARSLRGPFDAAATARGRPSDLALRGWLRGRAGFARIEGRARGPQSRLELHASTEGVRLAEIVEGAPEMRFQGEVELEIEPTPGGEEEEEGSELRLIARARPTRVGGVALPAVEVEAVLEEGALRIESARAPHLGGDLTARGRVGFDGDLDLQVTAQLGDVAADPNLRRYAPGAHGRVEARFALSRDAAQGRWRWSGRLLIRVFR